MNFNSMLTFNLWIPNLILVSIMGLISFWSKTILHAIAFWFSNFMPLALSIMGRSFLSKEYIFSKKNEIYDYMAPLIVFSIFQVLYAILIGVLWKKKYWRFQHKLKYDFGTKGKTLFSMYQYELVLYQSTVVFTPTHNMRFLFGRPQHHNLVLSALFLSYQLYYISFFYCTLVSSLPIIGFIIMGIQRESRLFVYIAQTVIFFQILITSFDFGISMCIFLSNISFDDVFVIYIPFSDLVSILLLVSLFVQTIRCQRNFGNGMDFILKYEPKPKEFEYEEDDEIFNKDDEYLSDDEDLSNNKNIVSYILEKIKIVKLYFVKFLRDILN
ncbi:hypothetical protein F8M41_016868 [Gigaspora margarita]|uniref:Uncharacterized protein n=2 Tax=Gigaspora margarita TaxID=4874 RepID=A0A8H4EMH2_GIGMA|nr:hypothetical protein F8M41_016868 [Gigaspora margarita]